MFWIFLMLVGGYLVWYFQTMSDVKKLRKQVEKDTEQLRSELQQQHVQTQQQQSLQTQQQHSLYDNQTSRLILQVWGTFDKFGKFQNEYAFSPNASGYAVTEYLINRMRGLEYSQDRINAYFFSYYYISYLAEVYRYICLHGDIDDEHHDKLLRTYLYTTINEVNDWWTQEKKRRN